MARNQQQRQEDANEVASSCDKMCHGEAILADAVIGVICMPVILVTCQQAAKDQRRTAIADCIQKRPSATQGFRPPPGRANIHKRGKSSAKASANKQGSGIKQHRFHCNCCYVEQNLPSCPQNVCDSKKHSSGSPSACESIHSNAEAQSSKHVAEGKHAD
eukprot:CAMPEP_0197683244 /NCGR_PEP_ID=MMETSP1338-20131121/97642_1 /TAXON_ID=43686 ORGANISM="Pelagodinium beii, Strain RCC1491" /NCGR_SAMPLE_ID=MMETSP1338 /ASSEMBLY_ACC=CAM_ASM_000754 /LENGTH=159 /DNA_ID=CAMNT_0043264803 /DNA_START=84 /DNA_END=563 /DNA_ORIENTATION=-